jgi:DNA-binding MarR family transcriptional regulator/predicted GNAT family N-acyltransferase
MDFFDKTGKMAIGSRLRMLTERITSDASEIYSLYGLDFKPKWFPVLFALAEGEAKTITNIAREIGHTHPSVSNIVKEMSSKKLIRVIADKSDKRRTKITLSNYGKTVYAKFVTECATDVAAAVEEVSRQSPHDLWKAIADWEELLTAKSMLQRVKEIRLAREADVVRIVAYESQYQEVFRRLNELWITEYWQLEPHDVECLSDPQRSILDKGGYIFVALYREMPVGVCALCTMDHPLYHYELAKLAVDPAVRGKGIGLVLCEAVIAKAKSLGAKVLFLESNTRLKPAIHTYKKLGFRELAEYHPAYERGDIQMELYLNDNK